MSMTGRVTSVKIRDDNDPSDISSYADAKVQLSKTSSKVLIKLPADDEIVVEFDLNDCFYMEERSVPGSVESIRINSQEKTVIIIDKNKQCTELLDYMRKYLAGQISPSPPPKKKPNNESKPIQNEKVNELIRALNQSNAEVAAKIARDLAREQQSIRFSLDMINESGDAPARPPPTPAVKPIELKLSIESFLINSCTGEQYDVAILPNTTIKDLKQIVRQEAQIEPNQQYWYINRDLLDDNYQFGVTRPAVDPKTVLILYIAKPQNN